MDFEVFSIVLPAILLIVGAYLWQRAIHLLKNGKKAKGVIFKNNFQGIGKNGVYHPVVRFLTDKQEWITEELRVGSPIAKPEGKRIDVVYDPEDPTEFEIYSTFRLEILPRLLVAVGLTGVILFSSAYLGLINL